MKQIRVTYPLRQRSADEPAFSPFEFTWDVAASGYRWETASVTLPIAREEPKLFLTDGNPLGVSQFVRRSAPMREWPALFRSFADLAPSHEEILAFANEHGPLGEPVSAAIALPRREPSNQGITVDIGDREEKFVALGESLDAWTEQISHMRGAITLWDAVETKSASLREHIHWQSNRVIYRDEGGWSLIASPETHPELAARLTAGDLVSPALVYLQSTVNGRLAEHASARLLSDPARTHLRLHVVPHSLLAALWLQFARALDGQRRYVMCAECGRWLELSADVRRSDARFCSGTCRTRRHRRRRRQMEAASTNMAAAPQKRPQPAVRDGASHLSRAQSKNRT